MSKRPFPIAEIGAAIEATLETGKSAFTPATKVVTYDNYWHLQTSAAALVARVPLQVVRHVGMVQEIGEFGNYRQRHRFLIRHFFQMAGSSAPADQRMATGEILLPLFDFGPTFDQWPELSLPNGAMLESASPHSGQPDEEFVANNIMGFQMGLDVVVQSVLLY